MFHIKPSNSLRLNLPVDCGSNVAAVPNSTELPTSTFECRAARIAETFGLTRLECQCESNVSHIARNQWLALFVQLRQRNDRMTVGVFLQAVKATARRWF